MASQKTGEPAVTALMKVYYDRMLIERLEPKTYLYQLGVKKPLPAYNSSKVEFTGYRNMKPILAKQSDEFGSTQVYISAYKIDATVEERDNYVKLSTFLKKTSIDPNVQGAVEVLSDQMAKSVEMLIRQKVLGQIGYDNRSSAPLCSFNTELTNVNTQGVYTMSSAQAVFRFWSPFTILHNKTALGVSACHTRTLAGTAMSVNTIKHAVNYLRAQDVEPYSDGQYVLYCHTMVADVLMADPKWKSWNSPQNAKETMYRGEIGNIFGARVIVGNMAPRYVYSAAPWTTASGAFNVSFLFGKGAFGVTELANAGTNNRGFEIIIKSSGPQTTSDPVNKINTIAGKMVMTAVALNKACAVGIATTDKAVSSAS